MLCVLVSFVFFFFFQAEDGIRDGHVTGVQRVLFRSLPAVRLHLEDATGLLARTAAKQTETRLLSRLSKLGGAGRSEERRVGKEGGARWAEYQEEKKRKKVM